MKGKEYYKEKMRENPADAIVLAVSILAYRASLILLAAILFAMYQWGGVFLYFWLVLHVLVTLFLRSFTKIIAESMREKIESAEE